MTATENTEGLRRLLEHWRKQDELRKGPERPKLSREQREEMRLSAYAQTALDNEIRQLSVAPEGQRAKQAYASAAALGNLVGAGILPREVAEQGLLGACATCGLAASEARGHVCRGLNDGEKTPRVPPEANGHAPRFEWPKKKEAASLKPAEPEPWELPIPLDAPLSAAPFPLGCLPAALQRYVEECAWASNTPPDFTTVPLLVLAGAAIGNSCRLAITRNHFQSACLFAGVVGRPGSGKSIPLEYLLEPFEAVERRWREDFDAKLSTREEAGKDSRDDKPALRRCLCDDTTPEGLVRCLDGNPRGLARVLDELSALATGMNQYKDGGKGSERQLYLKVWSGATIRVDRNKLEGVPLVVRRPFLSVLGGIQPQVIESLRGETQNGKPAADDGFLDRFLICFPQELPAVEEQWREISQESISTWDATVAALYEPECELRDGVPWSQLLHLNTGGRDAWQEATRQHATELNQPNFPDWLRGPWSKLRGYGARLALIIHRLRQVLGETEEADVDRFSVEAGWLLVGYFKSHTRKLLAAMGSDPRVEEARRVLAWIARQPDLATFSRRDVYKDLHRSFRRPEDLEAPLRLLSEHRYLAPLEEPRMGPGRKPAPKYTVNPLGRHTIDRMDRINVDA